MTFDQLLLEKFEEALEKDISTKTDKESLTIINRYISSLERLRKKIGNKVIDNIRNSQS